MKHLRLFAVAAILIGGLLLKDYFFGLPSVERLGAEIQDLEKRISTPDPLRAASDFPAAFLTRSGVIKYTNEQRQASGLPVLGISAKLNTAAAHKVQDMFAKQYFAHVAPDGKRASDLAGAAGYEYIAIGENLALGNFENDQALVQAWMDSPGHRANIMDRRFQDIGVAAVKGIFEGRSTWLAVQIFGLPKSACPAPNSDMKTKIANNEATLDRMQAELETLKDVLEGRWPGTKRDEYNDRIKEYNDMVQKYNALLEMTKNMITLYNNEVNAFNSCVKN